MNKQKNTHRNVIDRALYLGFGCAFSFMILVGALLTSFKASAENTMVDDVTINIPVSCSMTGIIDANDEHEATINNGIYAEDIGVTTLQTFCNDVDGFSVYAIGYTGNVEGTNTMVGQSTGLTINTDVYSQGDTTSSWAMKLTKVTDTSAAFNPTNLSIENSFDSYHAVPSTYTRVAKYEAQTGSSATDRTLGSKIETTYAVFIAGKQSADTYAGRVKYLLVHPASYRSISSTAVTVNFTIPSGSNMSFSDNRTTNTVIYRQICTDPNDSTTCKFMVTDGEYEEPTNYKGGWVMTLPAGSIVYALENADEMILGLAQLGGASYLGATLTIPAYDGQAIRYDGNGATGGDMSSVASRFMMVVNNNETTYSSNSTTLIAPNYYKTGYGFAGWSTSSSATPGNGTIFGPNQTITASDVSFDSDGTDTLYAVWVASTGNMQGFNCSNLSAGAVTALTDTRDGNTYAVGKLADGNCWMMENLRLDGDASLTADNTNNPAISRLGKPTDNWCTTENAECVDQSIFNDNNTRLNGFNNSGDQLMTSYYWGGDTDNIGKRVSWYGYGNLYNWYAATAGNGTYVHNSDNASGDICPIGWALPTSYTDGQFSVLDLAMGGTGSAQNTEAASSRWRRYPNNFVYSGEWNTVYDARDRSYNGYYWGRTLNYSLEFYSNHVSPGLFADYKSDGHAVRCILPYANF